MKLLVVWCVSAVSKPLQHAPCDVGLVVAVGVLEEEQVGRLRDEHAAVVELEARWGSSDRRRRRCTCRPCRRRWCPRG